MCQFDGDDKGRRGGAGHGLVGEGKLRVVERHDHAYEEDADDVKDDNSVEGELDRARDGLAGILGFSNGHTNQLGSQEGKGRRDQRGVEIEESRQRAFCDAVTKFTIECAKKKKKKKKG